MQVKNNQIDNLIFQALSFVSSDQYQNASDIVESILNNKNSLSELNIYHWQYIGDIYLAMGKFELARSAYIKANNTPAVAFTLIVVGKLQEASGIMSSANDSPAKCWCNFLIDLFSEKKQIRKRPSFLVVRHFLELTVYYLLIAKNNLYIQILLERMNVLLQINLDSEKLIGYGFLNYGELDQALKYLQNASRRNHLDGEIFFMLGRLYIMKNMYQEAMSMLQNAQVLLPEHYPTMELIERIKSKV